MRTDSEILTDYNDVWNEWYTIPSLMRHTGRIVIELLLDIRNQNETIQRTCRTQPRLGSVRGIGLG